MTMGRVTIKRLRFGFVRVFTRPWEATGRPRTRPFGSAKSTIWGTGFVPHDQCALNEHPLQSPVGGRIGPQKGGLTVSLFARLILV